MNDFVVIGDHKLPTLLAISQSEQERGLMHREPPFPNMSFIYSEPRINSFWMNNVKAPLDIVFCLNNKVVSIAHGEPYSTRLINAELPSDLVVEFPYGTCEKLGIKQGDPIKLEFTPASKAKILLAHC